MKITITGNLGSGKSSVAKMLSNDLKFKYISTGQLHREIASEYKMNSLQLNSIAEVDETIDNRIDFILGDLNESDEDLVIDSRMAWHFVKNTLKLYLEVDPDIGAARILKDNDRLNEPSYNSQSGARSVVSERQLLENRRFAKKYKVNCGDLNNYDYVINSSLVSVKEVSKLIKFIITNLSMEQKVAKRWISPKIIFPTEHVRSLASAEAKDLINKVKMQGFRYDYSIQVVLFKGYYFIWNGHKRVSAALINKVAIIPVDVIAEGENYIHTGHSVPQFIKAVINKSWYDDWEECHQFRFYRYPDVSSLNLG